MKLTHLICTLVAFFTMTSFATLSAQSRKTVGDATYYGHQFHGRRTSDGSTYHRDSLTCAHRTLPFGTLLKVRNKTNGREVVVKVTDRGPFRRGGIVDLSYAAAKEIGMVSSGVVPVEIETLSSAAAMAQADNTKNGDNLLPELQLLDPTDGNYYSMTDWIKRGKEEREQAKLQTQNRQHIADYVANAQAKNKSWHILNDKLTAKASK